MPQVGGEDFKLDGQVEGTRGPSRKAVLSRLQQGASSGIEPPGSEVTKYKNFFPDSEYCMKMADALASEVKAGNMTGPINPDSFHNTKVNAFMAIPKPSGHSIYNLNLSCVFRCFRLLNLI